MARPRKPLNAVSVVPPVREWNRAWVAMWGVLFPSAAAAAFFLPFWQWVGAASILFGIPEAIGAWSSSDRLPPLTHVLVKYVDREVSFPVLYGLFGSVAGYWLGFNRPAAMGGLFALLGWINAHFERRYEGRG